MHIKIICIGKDRREEFAPALERYRKQLPWKLDIVEKQPKKPNVPVEQRMLEEARMMMDIGLKADIRVALDEHGQVMGSEKFAVQLGEWRDSGTKEIAFFIGGADGLHRAVVQSCQLKLAFGKMTWPHQLARLMLVEQLYRAYTILEGHPYHRA